MVHNTKNLRYSEWKKKNFIVTIMHQNVCFTHFSVSVFFECAV